MFLGVRRKVFISHYSGDRVEVDEFIDRFANREDVFMPRVLGANDNDEFIESNNPEYVMTQIRQKYLQDSTVTIVLIGSCTHSRRFIDWEIKSSLRQGSYTPNGLLGIRLPSQGESAHLPLRFKENWNSEGNCYARYCQYPKTASELRGWIEDAFQARSGRPNLINNPHDMMKYNAKCRVCGITH